MCVSPSQWKCRDLHDLDESLVLLILGEIGGRAKGSWPHGLFVPGLCIFRIRIRSLQCDSCKVREIWLSCAAESLENMMHETIQLKSSDNAMQQFHEAT